MCSINSQVLYNHNLHPSVHIDRIKWLQPLKKLTALHTNQVFHSSIHLQYQIHNVKSVVSQTYIYANFITIFVNFDNLTLLRTFE